MNIQEATRESLKSGKHMSRTDSDIEFKIKPTETPDCCIISDMKGKATCRGWQPQADDLMSECWIIVD